MPHLVASILAIAGGLVACGRAGLDDLETPAAVRPDGGGALADGLGPDSDSAARVDAGAVVDGSAAADANRDAPRGDAVPPEAAPDADAGIPLDATSEDAAETGASRGPMRVFVTQERWSGDLESAAINAGEPGVTGGLAAGDALCTLTARGASLGGAWIAWLSDGQTNAIDRIRDVGPWVRMDGVEVFADKAALTGDPLASLTLDERGDLVDFAPWTGTSADGTAAPETCRDSTSSGGQDYGLAGANNATTERKWSAATIPLCNSPYNLYCFEQ